MVDIFHHHVNDHTVASTHQEYSPDLGDGLYPTQESIDHRSLILGKLDEGHRQFSAVLGLGCCQGRGF
jgi:hypothetical protein